MSTANIADHFKKLFGCKFIYQNEKVYNYNGVYWKCEEKIVPSLNNFISKETKLQLKIYMSNYLLIWLS